jgi:hypothetical protein
MLHEPGPPLIKRCDDDEAIDDGIGVAPNENVHAARGAVGTDAASTMPAWASEAVAQSPAKMMCRTTMKPSCYCLTY